MLVAGDDREPSMPGNGGNPGVVDRDRRARLLEFEPHCTVGMRHLTVDQRDFNRGQAGVEPVGIAFVVPLLADAIIELAENDDGDHDLGCRSQHGFDGSISLGPG